MAAPEKPAESAQECLGAVRMAGRLSAAFDLDVDRRDVSVLVACGHLRQADTYKGWPLYDVADALAVDRDVLTQIVAVGWHWSDIARLAEELKLSVGEDGRYLVEEIDSLAATAGGE